MQIYLILLPFLTLFSIKDASNIRNKREEALDNTTGNAFEKLNVSVFQQISSFLINPQYTFSLNINLTTVARETLNPKMLNYGKLGIRMSYNEFDGDMVWLAHLKRTDFDDQLQIGQQLMLRMSGISNYEETVSKDSWKYPFLVHFTDYLLQNPVLLTPNFLKISVILFFNLKEYAVLARLACFNIKKFWVELSALNPSVLDFYGILDVLVKENHSAIIRELMDSNVVGGFYIWPEAVKKFLVATDSVGKIDLTHPSSFNLIVQSLTCEYPVYEDEESRKRVYERNKEMFFREELSRKYEIMNELRYGSFDYVIPESFDLKISRDLKDFANCAYLNKNYGMFNKLSEISFSYRLGSPLNSKIDARLLIKINITNADNKFIETLFSEAGKSEHFDELKGDFYDYFDGKRRYDPRIIFLAKDAQEFGQILDQENYVDMEKMFAYLETNFAKDYKTDALFAFIKRHEATPNKFIFDDDIGLVFIKFPLANFNRLAHLPEFVAFFNYFSKTANLFVEGTPHEILQCIRNDPMFEIICEYRKAFTIAYDNLVPSLLFMVNNENELERLQVFCRRTNLFILINELIQKNRDQEFLLKTSLAIPIRWLLKNSSILALEAIPERLLNEFLTESQITKHISEFFRAVSLKSIPELSAEYPPVQRNSLTPIKVIFTFTDRNFTDRRSSLEYISLLRGIIFDISIE